MKKISSLITITAIIIFIASCKKDSIQTNLSAVSKIDLSKADSMIFTPEGWLPKSQVHLIENGYHLEIKNGHALKVHTGSGKLIEDFGVIRGTGSNFKAQPSNQGFKNLNSINNSTAPSGNGWATYSQWGNTNGQPINLFSTNWIVPAAPTSNNGQLIYIWNGLEPYEVDTNPNNLVIQPVLQWGPNGTGPNTFGGQYWTISNWCAWPGGAAYTTPQTNISPGTNLQGILTYTGRQADGSYNYTSAFTGHANVMNVTEGTQYSKQGGGNINIPNIPLENWAYEVLEVVNIIQSTNYPAQLSVNMTNINIQTGPPGVYTPAALNWTPEITTLATLGEHTNIINNNPSGAGEVDLYFHFGMQGVYARLEGGTPHTYTVNYNSIFSQVRRWDPNAPTPVGSQQVYRTMTPINIKFYSDAACTHPLVLANAISVSVTSTATHASGSTYVTTYSVPSGVSSFSIGTTDDVEITGVGSFNLAPIYVDYELNNSFSYTTEPDINLSFE